MGHGAGVEERRGAYRVVGRRGGINHLEDLDVDGRVILKLVLNRLRGY